MVIFCFGVYFKTDDYKSEWGIESCCHGNQCLKSLKNYLKSTDGPILIPFYPNCFSIDSLH